MSSPKKMENKIRLAGSLFSGGGLGDVGIEWGSKIPVIAACELLPSRASLIRKNFPATKVFEGDIWKVRNSYIQYFRKVLKGQSPWLLTLSPPCQGMSSNGAGRISSAIRAGNRPLEDERNRLILPGIEVLEALQPEWFLLENVRRMENTVIRNERNQPENILTCLARRMHPFGYTLRSCILDFRNYGVPHHRERLITIGCRIPKVVAHFPKVADVLCSGISPFHPLPTHGEGTNQVWLTLRRAIGKLPCLDSRTNWKDPNDPYHCVPKWNDNQYFWMKNTPEGQTAFDNAYCVDCGTMKTNQDEVSCRVCRKPLPVPQMKKSGKVRLIKGFRSSYRRMWWDRPGGTLTMNSGVISSDLKGHPEQNRVLSLREILRLSTLDHQQWKKSYDFSGVALGKWDESQSFSARLVREVIGESIPPLAMKCMVDHLLRLEASTE